MENQNIIGSGEQLKIDNTSVLPQKNNRNNNNNSSNSNSNNRNNRYRHNNNNNNNNNNNRNRVNRNHYNEDEDPELLLAFEISKAEYEEQQKRNNTSSTNTTSTTTNTTTTTTTNTAPINLSNNNNSTQTPQTNSGGLENKRGKKGQVDMTHLLKFQSTSPHHRSPYINSSSHINSNSYRPPRNNYRGNSSSNNHNHSHNHNHNHNNHNNNRNKNNYKKPIQDTTFLQANYLFKINPFGNYSNALREVDSIVSWNKVEQVVYLTHEETQFQCPICLDNPVIPKITKCGHIMCYTCILRSLFHTTKCPLCLLPIESKEDLKSLEIKKTKKYKDGDEISLQLVKYQEGSTVPFLSTEPIPEKISFPLNGEKSCLFSKFSIIKNINEIVDAETNQVIRSREAAISECDSELLKFLNEALLGIQDRQESFKKLLETRSSENSTFITIPIKSSNKKDFDSYQCSNNFEIRMALEEYFNSTEQDCSTPDENSDDEENSSLNNSNTNLSNNNRNNDSINSNESNSNININNSNNIKVPLSTLSSTNSVPGAELSLESFSYENQPSNGLFYLYQSEDGQKIYLHPLCMKILDYEYKKANTLPDKITAKVYEFEDYQVTEQSRKQYKSFNVLALTTGITFAEIDLSSVVSKETLQHFHKDIKKRKDARFNKKKKEQKIQRDKELERAKDLERALELREISRKEKQLEMEREAQRIEQEKKDREEQLKNSAGQKIKRQLGFLEAIQTHKNIDSPDEFPLLFAKK
ncbi:hypothetical protein DICPUDRAFT_159888 [Dictyostelium purpureum]|uniref:RING-type domain-containing protein n=1 Tax=Dictyostelium purpureum TaxID=5786 RepID=F1A576_DICPU|nr:uncharacterized protein DICPUDRAFT_159888 [Dictyostelium purpureum]EGC28655.1 hypothetical protein DICPUDRAFT_159888 [Dictyostelium purpureum]|eukprot:XP_003294820.1 hypothetical protein DICPUDRAFT_159888 [Dictyostelium purpureum]